MSKTYNNMTLGECCSERGLTFPPTLQQLADALPPESTWTKHTKTWRASGPTPHWWSVLVLVTDDEHLDRARLAVESHRAAAKNHSQES